MVKGPMFKKVFLWCEVVMSAGILILTTPILVSAIKYGVLFNKPPAVIIVSLLAVLYLMSGIAGLCNRPTTKFLHLSGALATLIISLMMSSMSAPKCCPGSDLLVFSLSLYAAIVIYFFIFRFKERPA